jgi:hypothetical protein
MKATLFRWLAASLAISFIVTNAIAQEQLSEAEKAKRAQAVYALAGPAAEHKQLEQLVGTWEQEIKYWMKPGAKPVTVKGRCVNRMVLGGRFLVSEGKGGEGAMVVETMSLLGFDRRFKRFTTVGFDTLATYYVTAAGPFDEKQKAIVMYGEDHDPVLGHTQKYDTILRIASPDRYVIEVVFKDAVHTEGKGEFKAVEVTHTRSK